MKRTDDKRILTEYQVFRATTSSQKGKEDRLVDSYGKSPCFRLTMVKCRWVTSRPMVGAGTALGSKSITMEVASSTRLSFLSLNSRAAAGSAHRDSAVLGKSRGAQNAADRMSIRLAAMPAYGAGRRGVGCVARWNKRFGSTAAAGP
jgi:hypothetical protein